MTDSEKLDFLVNKFGSLDEKVTSLDERMSHVEGDITEIKADIHQLQNHDKLILDEVERVHSILDKHKSNKSVHTA